MTGNHVFQRHAIHELHGNERLAFVLPNLVDGANIRMVERGSSTSFAAKAFERLWVFSYILGEELQSDKATKFGVLGLVYDTHPAAAQLLDDAVVRNGLADHKDGAMLGGMLGQVNGAAPL